MGQNTFVLLSRVSVCAQTRGNVGWSWELHQWGQAEGDHHVGNEERCFTPGAKPLTLPESRDQVAWFRVAINSIRLLWWVPCVPSHLLLPGFPYLLKALHQGPGRDSWKSRCWLWAASEHLCAARPPRSAHGGARPCLWVRALPEVRLLASVRWVS